MQNQWKYVCEVPCSKTSFESNLFLDGHENRKKMNLQFQNYLCGKTGRIDCIATRTMLSSICFLVNVCLVEMLLALSFISAYYLISNFYT